MASCKPSYYILRKQFSLHLLTQILLGYVGMRNPTRNASPTPCNEPKSESHCRPHDLTQTLECIHLDVYRQINDKYKSDEHHLAIPSLALGKFPTGSHRFEDENEYNTVPCGPERSRSGLRVKLTTLTFFASWYIHFLSLPSHVGPIVP